MAGLTSITNRISGKKDPRHYWKRRFLRFFPRGFADPKYIAWERGYKWEAHQRFVESLSREKFAALLSRRRFREVSDICIRLESRTNLLFSFEKMAIRDAVRAPKGAKLFAEGLYRLLHGNEPLEERFSAWCAAIGALPRRQTRVLTHPVVTVFPFIADPRRHIFLKPVVTKTAAERLRFEFRYESTPSWEVYLSLLTMVGGIREAINDLKPMDMIDLQSFIWVTGSTEYE